MMCEHCLQGAARSRRELATHNRWIASGHPLPYPCIKCRGVEWASTDAAIPAPLSPGRHAILFVILTGLFFVNIFDKLMRKIR